MAKRIVIWGTGFVGKMVIPEVLRHPDFELVGVGVSNPAKVGVDVGEICGLPEPTGVLATDDVDPDTAGYEDAYLAGLAPESGLYPHDPRERAIIDQWSYWQAIHLGPAMQKLAMERYFKKKYGFGEPDPAAIEKAEKDVDQFLRVLEDDLKDKDWVAGRLSIVDFAVASTFVFRKEAGISLADFPHVVAWIERVEARPSWRKAIEPIVAAA